MIDTLPSEEHIGEWNGSPIKDEKNVNQWMDDEELMRR
jgi:hypothetical protein